MNARKVHRSQATLIRTHPCKKVYLNPRIKHVWKYIPDYRAKIYCECPTNGESQTARYISADLYDELRHLFCLTRTWQSIR